MNRRIILNLVIALIVLFGAAVGSAPVGAAPGGGGPTDQPYKPCPPKIRTAPPYTDSDGDGLTDCEEVNIFGTNKIKKDTDLDGFTDFEEIANYGTDPLLNDTDGDKFGNDSQEIEVYGTDPLTPDVDADGDGYSDGAEITLGLDPVNPDTDGDGVQDFWDSRCGKGWYEYSKALINDYDGDALSDYDEKYVYITSGCMADTDLDGVDDAEEIEAGTDPTGPGTPPGI